VKKNPLTGAPVVVALVLFVVVTVAFMAVFALGSQTANGVETLSVAELKDRADALLVDADPERGAALVVTYACTSCHREGAANGIAPAFEGIAARSAERDLQLSAAAYIYQSIAQPGAFLVEGYVNAMPQNYGTRMTDQEMGDVIAYLLQPDAR
jgi:cytochrome c551/c552